MFRPQKMLKSQRFFDPCLPVVKEVNNEFISVVESQIGGELPPCENFDLKKMIDANVNLEQVNSKILGSRTMNVGGFLNENRVDEPVDESVDEPHNYISKQGE